MHARWRVKLVESNRGLRRWPDGIELPVTGMMSFRLPAQASLGRSPSAVIRLAPWSPMVPRFGV